MRAGVRAERACGRLGKADAEVTAEETPAQVVEHIHRHSDMSKGEFDQLQQTALKVTYIEGKVRQLLERRKPKWVIDK